MRHQITQILTSKFIAPPDRFIEATDAILAELRGQKESKIKDLVWLGGGGRYHAENYVIEDISTPRREVRRLLCASFGTTYIADFAGTRPLENAKSAANTHRRSAIMAAFEGAQ
jgi:hypothetical protein